jgi:hypothetical protein
MARPVTFSTRVRRLKSHIKAGDIEAFLAELMIIGIDANALEDYKMSPRNMFEMAELLVKIKRGKGDKLEGEDDTWLRVIEGGD